MYNPRLSRHFSSKTWQRRIKIHFTSYFGIISAYPEQPDALEGSITNAVRQEKIIYIALPNIAGIAF